MRTEEYMRIDPKMMGWLFLGRDRDRRTDLTSAPHGSRAEPGWDATCSATQRVQQRLLWSYQVVDGQPRAAHPRRHVTGT